MPGVPEIESLFCISEEEIPPLISVVLENLSFLSKEECSSLISAVLEIIFFTLSTGSEVELISDCSKEDLLKGGFKRECTGAEEEPLKGAFKR
ncbi:MAG: hypothetical protein BWY64_03982 [bacterium ADurb.Bin363]|nr:MAG: hypothetical protein BWY64_03982 [bacterium ADurb.Bin363]